VDIDCNTETSIYVNKRKREILIKVVGPMILNPVFILFCHDFGLDSCPLELQFLSMTDSLLNQTIVLTVMIVFKLSSYYEYRYL